MFLKLIFKYLLLAFIVQDLCFIESSLLQPERSQLLDCISSRNCSDASLNDDQRDTPIVPVNQSCVLNTNSDQASTSYICTPDNSSEEINKKHYVEVYIKRPDLDTNQIDLGTDLTIECRLNSSLLQASQAKLDIKLRWLRSVADSAGLNQSISFTDTDSYITIIAATTRIWTVQNNGGLELKVNDFQLTDSGNYYCQAISSKNSTQDEVLISEAKIQLISKQANNEASLSFGDPPIYSQENLLKILPSLKVLPEFQEVSPGEKVQFFCVTTGEDPDPEPDAIKWSFEYSERMQLPHKSPTKYDRISGNISQIDNGLIIWSVSNEHSGFYKCSIELNDFQLKVEAIGELAVRSSADSAPLVFVSPEVVRLSVNGTASILCKATGYPPPDILWYRVDEIKSINTVENDTAIIADSFTKTSLGLEDLKTEIISYKDSLLYCNYNDCHDVTSTTGSKNLQVTGVGIIHIGPAQAMHQGQYVCRANNTHGSNQASTIVDVEFREPPSIKIEPPKEQTVVINNDSKEVKNVTFVCSIESGRPEPKLRWLRTTNTVKNINQPLPNNLDNLDVYDLTRISNAGANISVWSQDDKSLTLSLSSISLEDEGDYICLGENQWGRHSVLAHLNVHKPMSIKIAQSSPLLVRINESFHLDCIADGHPIPLDIEWSRSDRGAFFSLISKPSNILDSQERAVLKFDRVTADDSGEYTCNARDPKNPTAILRDTIMVVVEEPTKLVDRLSLNDSSKRSNSLLPRLIVRPSKVSAKVGSNVTLDCLAVSGLQPTVVEWIGPPIIVNDTNGNNASITMPNIKPYYRAVNDNSNSYTAEGQLLQFGSKLKIININKAHEGVYQCKGRNKIGVENAPALIRVLDNPQTTSHQWGETSTSNQNSNSQLLTKTKVAKVGTNIELKCQVLGMEQPITSWSRDGMGLPESSVQIEHNLWIQNVSYNDNGLYVCSARSKQPNRVIQAKINLLVKGNDDASSPRSQRNLTAKIVASKNQVNVGDSITLECIVSQQSQLKKDEAESDSRTNNDFLNEIERNVVWTNLHSGQSLFQDNVYIQNNLLIIYELRAENSATYRCNYNDLSLNTDFKLQVFDAVEQNSTNKSSESGYQDSSTQIKKISLINQTQIVAANGQRAEIVQSSVGAYFKLECPSQNKVYHWTRGNVPERRLQDDNKPLIIQQIDTKDADIYRCRAVNEQPHNFIVQVLRPVARFLQRPVSFITLPSISGADHQLDLELKFLPEDENGLILFNGQHQQQISTFNNRTIINSGGDYISLGLNSGHLEFEFELGDGTTLLRSSQPLSLNQWHKFVIERNRRGAVMYVDRQPPMSNSSAGKFFNLNLDSVLYVGGHQFFMMNKTTTTKTTRLFHKYWKGFQGCISLLRIFGNEVNLMARNRSVSVGIYECDKMECSKSATDCNQMNGICQVDRGWWSSEDSNVTGMAQNSRLDAIRRASGNDDMRCICLPGYSGDSCNEEIPSSSAINSTGQSSLSLKIPAIKTQYVQLNGACDLLKPCSTNGTAKCQSLSSTSFRCHCSLGFMGADCSKSAMFAGSETSVGFNAHAYLQIRFHKPEEIITYRNNHSDTAINESSESETSFTSHYTKLISFADNLNITFSLQTKSSYGLLFYIGQAPSNNSSLTQITGNSHQISKSMVANLLAKFSSTIHDYLSIAIVDGHLELNYELGSGIAVIRSSQRVNDGKEHHIVVTRSGKWSRLVIDNQFKQEGSSPGKLSVLNIDHAYIYLGGLPNLADSLATNYLSKFAGCMSNLEINSLGPLNLIKSDNISQIKDSQNLLPCNRLLISQAPKPNDGSPNKSSNGNDDNGESGNVTSSSKRPKPYQSPVTGESDDPDEM